jgi:hypothetical protein
MFHLLVAQLQLTTNSLPGKEAAPAQVYLVPDVCVGEEKVQLPQIPPALLQPSMIL